MAPATSAMPPAPIEAHADRLQWPDRDKMLAAIRGRGSFDAREVTAEHEGELRIHS